MRAARALLDWTQQQLGDVSKVGVATIKRMEKGAGPVQGRHDNALKVLAAFEAAGVEFIDGPTPGVRLKPSVSEGVGAS